MTTQHIYQIVDSTVIHNKLHEETLRAKRHTGINGTRTLRMRNNLHAKCPHFKRSALAVFNKLLNNQVSAIAHLIEIEPCHSLENDKIGKTGTTCWSVAINTDCRVAT